MKLKISVSINIRNIMIDIEMSQTPPQKNKPTAQA